MDTIICGILAIQFWRVPPAVAYLACCDEDDSALRGVASPGRLAAARAEAFESSELGRALTRGGYTWNNAGEHARRIAHAAPYLAHALTLPVHVLVASSRELHSSSIIKPCLWSTDIPFDSLCQIGDELWVQKPEFALLQIMGSSSLGTSALYAAELMGTYSPYRVPGSYFPLVEGLLRKGGRSSFGGWRPTLRKDGTTADLWSRPALVTPESLEDLTRRAQTQRGVRRAKDLARLIPPGAASPFEAKAGILLGLPRSLGGEGHEGMAFNARLDLNREARLLAKRRHCYADLYWEDALLDLECQSSLVHDNEEGYLSDADRATSLLHMGITVLPVTYGQISDERRFAALSETVASLRGVSLKKKGPRQLEAAHELRRELFGPRSFALGIH